MVSAQFPRHVDRSWIQKPFLLLQVFREAIAAASSSSVPSREGCPTTINHQSPLPPPSSSPPAAITFGNRFAPPSPALPPAAAAAAAADAAGVTTISPLTSFSSSQSRLYLQQQRHRRQPATPLSTFVLPPSSESLAAFLSSIETALSGVDLEAPGSTASTPCPSIATIRPARETYLATWSEFYLSK